MTEPSEFSPKMASDPNTGPHDMARMAAERHDLRAALAANPAIYRDLRDRLGQIDDPVFHEALQTSAHRGDNAALTERDENDGDSPSTHLSNDEHSKAFDVAAGPESATVFPHQPFNAATPPPVPTDNVPPPPPPPPPLTRNDGKHDRRKWAPVVIVLAVVLAIGGGSFAVYRHLTQLGASSPDEVMSTFSQAIPNKDFISLFRMVSPAEANLLTNSADEISSSNSSDSGGKSKSEPGAMFSKDAIDSYLDSLNINASEMVYSVDQKSDGLAVASISSWALDLTINQSLADTLRTRYEAAKAGSLTDKENEFFSNLDFSEARYSGEVTESFFGDYPLEIVLVKEDGRWYVSPTMTLAQWEYQRRAQWDDRMASPDYEADFAAARGAESPEAAVEEIVDTALNARRTSDMFNDSVTGLLALPERRLAMVYGPTLVGDDSVFYQRGSEGVQIDWGLTSTDIGNNRSVVHPGTSTITIHPANADEMVTLSFRDGAVDISLPASENNTVTVDFTRQLANPDQLGIVVEKNGGTWHVSSLATLVNLFKLRPSDRAINDLYDLFKDAGMDPNSADDLTDALSQSTAIATPLVVIFDIASQLQDVEWGARYDDNSYGSGTYLDEYFNQCTAGDMAACDSLYYASSVGSDAEEYGQTCGDRDYLLSSGGMCESTYGSWYY